MTLLCNLESVYVQPVLHWRGGEGRGGVRLWGAARAGHRTLNTALHSCSCKDRCCYGRSEVLAAALGPGLPAPSCLSHPVPSSG